LPRYRRGSVLVKRQAARTPEQQGIRASSEKELRLAHRAGGHDDRRRAPPSVPAPHGPRQLRLRGPTEHRRPDSHPCARSTRSSGDATHPTSRSAIPREQVRRPQRQAKETHKVTRQQAQRKPIKPTKGTATNSVRACTSYPSMWVFGGVGAPFVLFEENSGYVSDLGPRLERGGRRTTASRSIKAPKTTSPLPDVKPKPPQPQGIRRPHLPAPRARDRIGTARHKHTGQHTQRPQSPPYPGRKPDQNE
jgi:hypothetical protein